ncbi:NlpC/P60 family protein, partial [Cutibacterium acnes]
MLAGLAVLPATVIIVPLLSVGSGALDDNSGGGGGSVG